MRESRFTDPEWGATMPFPVRVSVQVKGTEPVTSARRSRVRLCLVKTPWDLCEAWLYCSRMPNGTSMMNPAATEMSRNSTATS